MRWQRCPGPAAVPSWDMVPVAGRWAAVLAADPAGAITGDPAGVLTGDLTGIHAGDLVAQCATPPKTRGRGPPFPPAPFCSPPGAPLTPPVSCRSPGGDAAPTVSAMP